jgi:hypothetical protein
MINSGDFYSDKEKKMFELLGVKEMMNHLEPTSLYRVAIEEAFLENKTGPAVDSLRRCAKAFSNHKPFRMTEEFDALIILE